MAEAMGTSRYGRGGSRSLRFSDGIVVATLVAAAILITLPTWNSIFTLATNDQENSYILLVLPIAAWLAYLRRARFRLCRPRRTYAGTAMILAGFALDRVGFEMMVDLFRHVGALMIVFGAFVTVFGFHTLVRFRACAGALLFLIPVPGRIRQEIAIPLQEVSAVVTEWVIGFAGLPVERMGNVLVINGVEVAIAEACNGMRMVAALALVTYAFVFSVPIRFPVRILLLAISPVIAIVVNVTRLVPTSLMYGYSTEDQAELVHDIGGWAALCVAVGLLWAVTALLRWLRIPIDPYPVVRT